MSPRRPWWARAVLLGAVCATFGSGGAITSPAHAAVDMETGIADDAQLLYEGPDAAARAVKAWKAMGIDAVRLHARWAFVVPHPLDRRKPKGFRPRDPADPGYNWAALDRAITLLDDAGLRPIVALTGSGPLWATENPQLGNPRWRPRADMFGDFAHAVATRYRGRVSRYLVWNEPNQAGWLQPQFRCTAARVCTPVAPHLYRELFRSAAAAVRAADPGVPVIAGTLAPRGQPPHTRNATMRPLQFLRSLGCVTRAYRRDRTGACRTARPIRADAFSYHPHPVHLSPGQHDPEPDNAAIGDLKRLERALDRTSAAGVLVPVHGRRFQLELTEFGYQTNPPDPVSGVSPSRQAAWIQWATYLAWRDPRVKNITQYEWIDEPTKVATKTGAHYAGWQSGLLTVTRHRKPLAGAFPNPFYVDVARGGRARFWGQVRPGGATIVTLQQRATGGWRTVARVPTNALGYWVTDRRLSARARFRFTYPLPDAGGTVRTVASRSQAAGPAR